MSEDEEEGATRWDLRPAIHLLHSSSIASVVSGERRSTAVPGDLAGGSLVINAEGVSEAVRRAEPENESQEVPRGEEGVAVVDREPVREDALADHEDVVAVAERCRSLRALLLDTLDRHSRDRSRSFPPDLENGFQHLPNGTETGARLEERRTAPLENGIQYLQTGTEARARLEGRRTAPLDNGVPHLPTGTEAGVQLEEPRTAPLENGVQYLPAGTDAGVRLERPRTAPLMPPLLMPFHPMFPPPPILLQNLRPPFEHLRLIGNGTPVTQSFPEAPGLLSYEPLRHGPLGSWPMPTSGLPVPPRHARPNGFQPLVLSSASERRKEHLVTKLIATFPREARYLLRLPDVQNNPTGATDPTNEIHVFVDCSNILIGFFDTLKIMRGIPLRTRTRRDPFCFHSLTLILERGRPVAKRILVGSDGLMPFVSEAERCGYETSVLDRVVKTRELPLRPRANGVTMGNSAPSSGSEAVSGSRRRVEQAVDEVLHLKILESVVDAEEPSTIVLASGDAAEAEYSAGFLRMAERAMEKGWRVELVSFSKNMSSAYQHPNFLQKWREQFRIIMLDSFAEELLDA